MTPHARGIALCVLSACGFGAMAIFAKYGYEAGLNVTTTLVLRFSIAATLFWVVVAVRRSAMPARRFLLAGLLLGGMGYATQAGLFFGALTRIDASLTALLLYLYPGLVFVAALLLGRERATRRRLIALALASAGTALVLLAGGTGHVDALGVGMAVGAAVAYTVYILIMDRAVGDVDPFALSALVATGAAATFAVAATASGSLDLRFEAEGWGHLAGMAVVSTCLAVTAFLVGLRLVGPSTASIVSTIEPVVTVALAVSLLGEALAAGQLAGGALVLVAVLLLQWRAGSVQADEPPAVPAAPAPARAPAGEPARG